MPVVNIENTGTDPFTLRHDVHGDTTIAPGETKAVDWSVATVNLGDPGTVNDGANKSRDVELRSIYTTWGHYPGTPGAGSWDDHRPQFEVTDLDGNRIWMIADDPDGAKAVEHGTAEPPGTGGDALQDRIAHLEAELAKVLQAQERRDTHAAAASSPAAKAAEAGAVGTSSAPDAGDATSQADRNETREEIPKPAAGSTTARKDRPRSARVGGGSSTRKP